MFKTELHKNAFIAGVSVLSSIMGAGAGYKFAQGQLRSYYESLATEEILQAKAFYQKPDLDPIGEITEVNETNEGLIVEGVLTPSGKEAVEKLIGASKDPVNYNAMHEHPPAPDTTDIWKNKEETVVEEFDYETEMINRDPAMPYIVSEQEFNELNEEHEAIELVWYEDDETMSDAADEIIEDVDSKIGLDNLKFGYGSGNPKVVYVRNEMMDALFAIDLANGSYASIVHGEGSVL